MKATLWKRLTEPSPAVSSPHHRRQSQLMSSVMVLVIPLYVAMAFVSGFTRPLPVRPVEAALGVFIFVFAVLAYVLNRTAQYWRGSVVLTFVATSASLVIGLMEPVPTRAVATLLLGMTGVVYASFMLSFRATVRASLGYLAAVSVCAAFHPVVTPADWVIPAFLALYICGLTCVGAWLRDRQVAEIEAKTEKVAASEARARATLESALDAVVVLDPSGNVVEWGPHAEVLFGFDRGGVVGRPLVELIDPKGQQAELRHRLAKFERGRFEVMASSSDGHTFDCEVSVAALSGGRGAALFMRDVTERKRLEGQLVLADRMESMGRMVGGVAHEINNPLAYIVSNLGYLKTELKARFLPSPDTEELLEVLGETQDGVKRVQRIVADLRTFSYGGNSEELHPVDIETTLESALQIALGHMRSEHVTLTKDFGSAGRVMAQESRLGQVFLNLVMNAVQAHAVSSSDREVKVRSVREGHKVRVSVTDNGLGIQPEVKRRLFTPFFTTKPVGQGTGLGLYISHTIISGMKGEIAVDSEPGKGSTFTVVLPALD
ncbi:MAG: ATP-binding protein [Myxococcaceae bacterium]